MAKSWYGIDKRTIHRYALIPTKMNIPQMYGEYVKHQELEGRLIDVSHYKFCLVSAAAGFGKTRLVAEFAIDRPTPGCWLTLDENDNDFTRFWNYFISVLHSKYPQVGLEALRLLHTQPTTEAWFTALIMDIEQLSDHEVLILDDYHVVENQTIHDTVFRLIEHLPSIFHLVIITRTNPPFNLARMRANGMLLEIRTDDLKFSTDETSQFIQKVLRLNLQEEETKLLHDRTEGWPTGLQIAARALERTDQRETFLKSFSGGHPYIIDYLMEEVFQNLPKRTRDFLLQTSVLRCLYPALCTVVTGIEDGEVILQNLEHNNVFLFRDDIRPHCYRYHRLFAEMLLTVLRQTQPTIESGLHLRASRWCMDNHLIIEAIQHSLALDDYALSTQMIVENTPALMMRGEMVQLRMWLDTLPADYLRSNPRLTILYAWALLFDGQLDLIEGYLEIAENHLNGQDESDQVLQQFLALHGEIVAIRAESARLRGDYLGSIHLAQTSINLLPADNLLMRGLMLMNLSFNYAASGDVEKALNIFSENHYRHPNEQNTLLTSVTVVNRAWFYAEQGQLHRAWDLLLQTKTAILEQTPDWLPVIGIVEISLGELAYEWNDLDGAELHLLQGLELSKPWLYVRNLLPGYFTLAKIGHAQGNYAKVTTALNQAELLIRRVHLTPMLNQLKAFVTRLELRRGNVSAAVRWLRQSETHPQVDFERLTQVQVLIAVKRINEALFILEALLLNARKQQKQYAEIEILTLQAIAYEVLENTRQSETLLDQALRLAEPEGYIRVFADNQLKITPILKRLNQHHTSVYISELLEAINTELVSDEQLYSVLEEGELVESLTERERDVLVLLAQGLPNSAIAMQLVVGTGTVKTHVKNILSKLQAKNRTQAVIQARKLGLLPD